MTAHLDTQRLLRNARLATLVCLLSMSDGAEMSTMAQIRADEFGCPLAAPALADLKFDDSLHRLWYRRFWTGVCVDLPMFSCFSGQPYWTETMHRILLKLPEASRDSSHARMCALGKLVGYEWAKDNNIRKIDTRLVSRWIARLESATDPISELAAIEGEAKERLAGR